MELTYDEFYEKYMRLIRYIVYKFKFRTSREDVLQDIMIMIWQDFEKIKNTDIQNEKAYVCGIARNCCKTYIRREHERGLYICNSEDTIYRFSNNSMIYNVETDTRNGETIVLDDYIKNYRKERAEYSREYRKNHKESVAAYNKKYKQEHKDEINAQRRIYREKNRDKIREQQKEWRDKNRGKLKERQKKYREEHKEELKIRQKEYYQEHKEELNARRRKYDQEHKEQKRESDRRYREKNKDKIRAYQREYRQKKKEEKLNGKTS